MRRKNGMKEEERMNFYGSDAMTLHSIWLREVNEAIEESREIFIFDWKSKPHRHDNNQYFKFFSSIFITATKPNRIAYSTKYRWKRNHKIIKFSIANLVVYIEVKVCKLNDAMIELCIKFIWLFQFSIRRNHLNIFLHGFYPILRIEPY